MIRLLCRYSLVMFLVLAAYTGCDTPTKSAILTIDRSQCIGCAKCINVCEADAIRIISNKAVIGPSKWIRCCNCVEVCPVDVYEMDGGKSVVINADECLGCESCIEVCESEAITITEN